MTNHQQINVQTEQRIIALGYIYEHAGCLVLTVIRQVSAATLQYSDNNK